AIRASLKEGLGVGVEATPTLYINGEKMDGAATVAELTAMIDRALRDADAMAAPAPAAVSSGPTDKKAH
ncbi:MAG TPA: thioredoxin domain-containing protein, partial [Terriglobales bacterium]|nr:thioredoxin domain-containing protein [Terriglobales bacterium]